MQLRKPKIRPPVMIAGIKGANISAAMAAARWKTFWLAPAASFTASLDTPSMPATAVKS